MTKNNMTRTKKNESDKVSLKISEIGGSRRSPSTMQTKADKFYDQQRKAQDSKRA